MVVDEDVVEGRGRVTDSDRDKNDDEVELQYGDWWIGGCSRRHRVWGSPTDSEALPPAQLSAAGSHNSPAPIPSIPHLASTLMRQGDTKRI